MDIAEKAVKKGHHDSAVLTKKNDTLNDARRLLVKEIETLKDEIETLREGE